MAPSNKTMLFVCLLVAAVAVVVPVAQGQLFPPIPVFSINGTLFCSANLSAIGSSPPLANVTVQLRCGAGNGSLVASATTNNSGLFSIMVNLLTIPLSQLGQILSGGCRVVVTTPIVGCNATLATGGSLTSPLTFVGSTISGLFSILNFILNGFSIPVGI